MKTHLLWRQLTVVGYIVLLKKLSQSFLAEVCAASPRGVPVTALAQLSELHCGATAAYATVAPAARSAENFMVLMIVEWWRMELKV